MEMKNGMSAVSTDELYVFELNSLKLGNGIFVCQASGWVGAWSKFKNQMAPNKIIMGFRHEYGFGDYLILESHSKPQLDCGLPRRSWEIHSFSIKLNTLMWK